MCDDLFVAWSVCIVYIFRGNVLYISLDEPIVTRVLRFETLDFSSGFLSRLYLIIRKGEKSEKDSI